MPQFTLPAAVRHDPLASDTAALLVGAGSGVDNRPNVAAATPTGTTSAMPMPARRTIVRWLASIVIVFSGSVALPAPAQQTAAQRGEYLARAGDCVSCHTATGGVAFAGGGRLDTPFGYLLAPNITPDPATGIGRWSATDFYRALHDGVNKQGQYLFPAMPYTFYTRVTREDSDALYAYLFSLAPVRNPVTINHLRFPFDQRWSMLAWNELFFSPGTYQPDPARSAAWNRGAYLVEGLGHCSACHSPRDALGGIEQDKAFTGASIDGWYALNLTSNLATGLGKWTAADIAAYLRTGTLKTRTTVLGPMAEVVHNSTSGLTGPDLDAIGEYLKSLPPNSSLRASPPTPDPTRVQGARLYLDNCGGCHQAKGSGIPGVFPPLAGNGVVLAPDAADMLKVVLGGVPARNGYIPMPSFAPRLDDTDVAAILNYVRTSWGNTAAPNVTPLAASKMRDSLPGN
jgi:mono/diheme cytochrome c family protein